MLEPEPKPAELTIDQLNAWWEAMEEETQPSVIATSPFVYDIFARIGEFGPHSQVWKPRKKRRKRKFVKAENIRKQFPGTRMRKSNAEFWFGQK